MNPAWSDDALDQLADEWVVATPEERDEIERAVRRANRELAADPDVGESRGGATRVHIVPPLTVWYRVGSDGRVEVGGVSRFKTKK